VFPPNPYGTHEMEPHHIKHLATLAVPIAADEPRRCSHKRDGFKRVPQLISQQIGGTMFGLVTFAALQMAIYLSLSNHAPRA
jgi:hypothetical protein